MRFLSALLTPALFLLALLPAAAAGAPEQYQIGISRASTTGAKVVVRTDVPATHQVWWSLTETPPSCPPTPTAQCSARSTTPTKANAEHGRPIGGLLPNTDYWTWVVSWDANGNRAIPPPLTMSTRDRKNWPLPNDATMRPSNHLHYGGSTFNQFMFNVNKIACSVLEWSTSPTFDPPVTTKKAGTLAHSHWDLHGLTPSTKLYIRTTTKDMTAMMPTPLPGDTPESYAVKMDAAKAANQLPVCPTELSRDDAAHVVRPTLTYRTSPLPAIARLLWELLTAPLAYLGPSPAYADAMDVVDTGFDKIPNFSADPTVETIDSGMLSDAKNWKGGKLPGPTDATVVHKAHTLVLDIPLDVKHLSVEGALQSAEPVSITACNVQVFGGTIDFPGGGEGVTKDCPIDREHDPSAYGTGWIVVDGTIRLEGEEKTPWVWLAAEPRAGQRTLTLATTPEGWLIRDVLKLADTRHVKPSEMTAVKTGTFRPDQWLTLSNPGPARIAPQDETCVIAGISGTLVTCAEPLKFNHLGGRDPDGTVVMFPHVQNMTRSFVLRSANPSGTRGHMLITKRSNATIKNVEFRAMGRTTANALDSTVFDADGHVAIDLNPGTSTKPNPNLGKPRYGTNQIGRYPLHAHHLWGERRPAGKWIVEGGMPQFTFVGNTFSDAPRWATALHGSHGGFVSGNVCYNVVGACIVTEDGSESYNLIEGNAGIRFDGSGFGVESRGRNTSSGDMGHEGAGLWFRGGNNAIRGNVMAQCRFACFEMFLNLAGNRRIPNFPGADPRVTTESKSVFIPRTAPIEFSNNTAYASNFAGWDLWQDGLVPPITVNAKNFRAWNISSCAINVVYSMGFRLDGFTVRGDPAVLSDPKMNPAGNCGHDGVSWQLSNVDIRGLRLGLNGRAADQSLTDAFLQNEVNLVPWLAETFGTKLQTTPQRMIGTRVKSLPLPGKPHRQIEAKVAPGTRILRAVAPTEIRMHDWNGDNFSVWFLEQVPETMIAGRLTEPRLPDQLQGGMSNGENDRLYGVKLLGLFTPCKTQQDGFIGYICP